MKKIDMIIKPKGVRKKWSGILALLFWLMTGSNISSLFLQDHVLWYILMGVSLLAAVAMIVLMWFYYNLPHKLNMLEQDGAQ